MDRSREENIGLTQKLYVHPSYRGPTIVTSEVRRLKDKSSLVQVIKKHDLRILTLNLEKMTLHSAHSSAGKNSKDLKLMVVLSGLYKL
jgi:hypothetical protein